MKINYQSRSVSTTDIYDAFDPPLVFSVKAVPGLAWRQAASRLVNSDGQDIEAALETIDELCFGVSDGDEFVSLTNLEAVRGFYERIKDAAGEIALEIICELAVRLAVETNQHERGKIDALKKTSPQSETNSKPSAKVKA